MLWNGLWTWRKTDYVVITITRQQAGELREELFDSWHRQGGFIYTKASRSALWPTLPPLKGYREIINLQYKGRDVTISSIVQFQTQKKSCAIVLNTLSLPLMKTRQWLENTGVHIVHSLRAKCFKAKTKYGMQFLCWHKQD